MALIHMQQTVPTQSKLVTFFLPVLCRRLMFELHMHKALERRIGQLFVWQLSIETFHVQCQQFKIKLINPRHSSLHKAAKILWSCSHTEVVSLSDLNINTSDSSSSLFDFRCSSSHPVPNDPNGMELMAISKICVSAYKYNKSSKIQ